MENSELDEAAFQNLAAGDRGAFLPLADATSDIQQAYASIGLRDDPTDPASRRIARVVTLAKGTAIFKLSQWEEKLNRDTLSQWWSAGRPFDENDLGAREVFETAMINGVSMRELVRFISAVKLNWNLLDFYIEARLAVDIKAFWGQFDPKTSNDGPSTGGTATGATVTAEPAPGGDNDMVHYDTATAGDEVYLPNVLGGFGAWQFCVPNFSKEFIDPSSVVNIRSTDRDQLAAHFGLTAAELDSLVKIGERMRP